MLPKTIKLPLRAKLDVCYDANDDTLFAVFGAISSSNDDEEAAAHIAACVNAFHPDCDPAAEMAKLQAHKQILLDVLKYLPPRLLNDTLKKLNEL